MASKFWDEITYLVQNFSSCAIEFWEWISHVTFLYISFLYYDVQHSNNSQASMQCTSQHQTSIYNGFPLTLAKANYE